MNNAFRQCVTVSLAACIVLANGDGHWHTAITKNAGRGRSECGVAACDGKIYVIGGGKLATEAYDPASASWQQKAVPPLNINHFQPVTYNHNIYVLEAFTEGEYPKQPNLSQVYIYHPASDSWSAGTGLPGDRQRAAAGAALHGGKLYLVAGIKDGHTSGTSALFDEYDPATGTWTALPDAPHVRDHCAAAVIKDKLYVAGGRNTSYHEPDNFMAFFGKTVQEVDCYDFNSGHWSSLAAKLPLGSGGGSMVNFRDRLYYMGGERATATEPNQPRKNVFWLDPVSGSGWVATDSLAFARNGMGAAVDGDHIYVCGGAFAGGARGPGGPPPGTGKQDSTHRPPPPPAGNEPPSPLEVFSLR